MEDERVISFTQRLDDEGRTVLKPKTQADLEAMQTGLRNVRGVRFDTPAEMEQQPRVCPVALGDPYGLTECALEDDWKLFQQGKIGGEELASRVERRLDLAQRYRQEGLTPEIEAAIKQIESQATEQSEAERKEVSHGESDLPTAEHMAEGDAGGSATHSGEEA